MVDDGAEISLVLLEVALEYIHQICRTRYERDGTVYTSMYLSQ